MEVIKLQHFDPQLCVFGRVDIARSIPKTKTPKKIYEQPAENCERLKAFVGRPFDVV